MNRMAYWHQQNKDHTNMQKYYFIGINIDDTVDTQKYGMWCYSQKKI